MGHDCAHRSQPHLALLPHLHVDRGQALQQPTLASILESSAHLEGVYT
jgi:hypothetical protein